jgi:hypothetical protein
MALSKLGRTFTSKRRSLVERDPCARGSELEAS